VVVTVLEHAPRPTLSAAPKPAEITPAKSIGRVDDHEANARDSRQGQTRTRPVYSDFCRIAMTIDQDAPNTRRSKSVSKRPLLR
jgi:hypothetical protein